MVKRETGNGQRLKRTGQPLLRAGLRVFGIRQLNFRAPPLPRRGQALRMAPRMYTCISLSLSIYIYTYYYIYIYIYSKYIYIYIYTHVIIIIIITPRAIPRGSRSHGADDRPTRRVVLRESPHHNNSSNNHKIYSRNDSSNDSKHDSSLFDHIHVRLTNVYTSRFVRVILAQGPC